MHLHEFHPPNTQRITDSLRGVAREDLRPLLASLRVPLLDSFPFPSSRRLDLRQPGLLNLHPLGDHRPIRRFLGKQRPRRTENEGKPAHDPR